MQSDGGVHFFANAHFEEKYCSRTELGDMYVGAGGEPCDVFSTIFLGNDAPPFSSMLGHLNALTEHGSEEYVRAGVTFNGGPMLDLVLKVRYMESVPGHCASFVLVVGEGPAGYRMAEWKLQVVRLHNLRKLRH